MTYKERVERFGRDAARAYKREEYQRRKDKHKAQVYAYRAKNKEHWLAQNREYQRRRRIEDPDWDYAKSLKSRYGITLADYKRILQFQEGKCAICQMEFPKEAKRRPVVDHCHATDEVRGILCDLCNVMLGSARDSVEILAAALDYLRAYEKARVG